MSTDKHKERIETLQKAIDDIEGKSSTKMVSLELIVAIAVPILFLIGILVINPSFFQHTDGGDTSRDFKKIVMWTIGIGIASFAGFGFWYWYTGGKMVMLF